MSVPIPELVERQQHKFCQHYSLDVAKAIWTKFIQEKNIFGIKRKSPYLLESTPK